MLLERGQARPSEGLLGALASPSSSHLPVDFSAYQGSVHTMRCDAL